MAFEKDQTDITLPVNGTGDISAVNFLPKYFRTDINRKFINSTIDQMIKPGVVEKINSFTGRRYARATTVNDSFLSDVTATRENYQFEPVMVYKDTLNNVEFYKDYNDYLGQLTTFKGTTSNHSILNSQEYYAWNPHIDWDKFANFREYYWLPNGPDVVSVSGQSTSVVSTYTVGIVFDADNYAYVFTPNGFTRNPKLKLYKGQTYRFDIDTPGHPFALAISRVFNDQDPGIEYAPSNLSTLYNKGVVKYQYDAEGKLVISNEEYIEKGVIEFTVPDDVPDTLFYLSKNSVDTSGIIATYTILAASEINVNEEIVGKRSYKTANGIQLSNGMKLYFQGTVTPDEYSKGFWYVEGVGSAIKLVSDQSLEVPAIFTSKFNVPFDTFGFDQYPFEDASSFPGTKDYIVINRSSPDRNPWSRYNRWFHKDVITASAMANNRVANINQDARAKRPIIEFEAGLKLYQHGAKAKNNVDLVDTFTTDVFSTIEGSLGYNVDGVDLVDRMRVLFTADTDILVQGKIYQVKFITHNARRQITLIETVDTDPVLDDTVLVLMGNTQAGNMFYYTGIKWKIAQDKTSINQFPLFDLFDKDGISYTDNTTYPSSSFRGNTLFGYRLGTGTPDTELGFALSYRNISNVGDIVFDFSLLTDTFGYQSELHQTSLVNTDTSFLRKYNAFGTEFSYENGWKKAVAKSSQAVINSQIITNKLNNFPIDVYDNSATVTDLIIKIWVNGSRKYQDIDYIVSSNNNIAYIDFNRELAETNLLLIKTYSSANKNANGFYEIPINFEKNPLNDNITEVTLGEVNDHINSIADGHPEFIGIFPGASNLRDISKLASYGTRFVQHSGPLNLALYNLTDKDANLIKSLKFARREYAKFKRQFIYEANKTGFHGSARDHVDLILQTLAQTKTEARPFYFSDMVAIGTALKTLHLVEYPDAVFFALNRSFNLSTLSINAVTVYLNGIQLLHNKDYIFVDTFVKILNNLSRNDVVEVYEYENTAGSFIPPTPTKLGMYPKYQPGIIVDNTYSTTTTMIQGHDGSLVKAYNDYRDDLLIELEMRIFNNIKCEYDTTKIDIFDFVSGHERNTGIPQADVDAILLADFAQWLEIAGSPDYSSNTNWNEFDNFTLNYSNMGDKSGNPLNGYWRAIYKKYFDTDRPHTHPWEMIGFTIMPVWWEQVYGPAPYTKDNTILWSDLASGIIKTPGLPAQINSKFIRTTLLSNIPVDESGNLLSPLDCGLAQNYAILLSKNNFVFGDQAPVETAWRRSSDYPFSLITAWSILQPAHIIGLGFDCSRVKRDIVGNLVYSPTNKRIQLSELVFPTVNTSDTLVLTSGLVNYVVDFIVNNVTIKYQTYKTQLTNSKNQLAVKLAGFADKNKLKLVLDSRSPLNKSSVFVPDENYQIFFNVSSPLETAVFSGIIIEKSKTGYIILGYDKESPVFNYTAPIPRQRDSAITVGGISESFVNWNENTQYIAGNVVVNNGTYYRAVTTHTSNTVFDAIKFAILPSLPITGGETVLLRKDFESQVSSLPYGTVLASVQEVTDFMLGYENHLVAQGFEFSFFNNDTEALEDMKLCIKEFMFWVTQNWDIGTVLTLSPAANQLKFSKEFYVVDDIYDGFYDISILSGIGTRINSEFSNIFRNDQNEFGIKPLNTDDGIYLARLPLVQKEHIILIDNVTVFNDTIYDVAPGYRQERIKLVGYRTDNWTGGLHIPGFFYDNAKATEWNLWSDYAIGDLIKYKEFYYVANSKHSSTDVFDPEYWNQLNKKPEPSLYPNWDYKVNQFTDFYDLDSDNFDTEQQRLGQHLIGYQRRAYLENIITDSVSQYKFYQGFIQDKGTKNSLTKLFDALSGADKDSLEFYEEWAIRVGQYGAIENKYEVEYQLDETKFRLEPQLFELTNSISSRTDLVYEIAPHEAMLKPSDYTHSIFEEKSDISVFGFDSGYVRNLDVNLVSIVKDQLTLLSVDDIQVGDFVWIQREQQSWNVYRNVTVNNIVTDVVMSLPTDRSFDNALADFNNGFTVYFEHPVTEFKEDDIIGIRSEFISANGFFKVKEVFLNQVVILSNVPVSQESYNDSIVSGVSKFVKRRFANAADLNSTIENIIHNPDDKVWIDNTGNGNFGVFANNPVFSLQEETINSTTTADNFSSSFAVNKSNTVVVVSKNNQAEVFTRNAESFAKILLQTFLPDNAIAANTNFGADVSISADSRYIAIGVPDASNAVTYYKGELDPLSTYNVGDIVSDRGALWRANNTITGDNSTIANFSQDWEPVTLLTANAFGTPSSLTNQGLVYIYKLNLQTNTYFLQHVIVSPTPRTNEQFGYKVELRQTAAGITRLFVGAPGESGVDQGRIYFFETDYNDIWSNTRNRNYKGEWSALISYNENEIVSFNGILKQSTTNNVVESPSISNKWIDIDIVEYSGYIPQGAYILEDADSTAVYNLATNVGTTFDVNATGDILVLSASADYELLAQDVSIKTDRVSIFENQGRWKFLQYIDAEDSTDDFGYVISINETGNKIAIGAPTNDDQGIDRGVVYIYERATVNSVSTYSVVQILQSPFAEENEAFGTGIDFSHSRLAISAKNADMILSTTFDSYTQLEFVIVGEDGFDNPIYSRYVLDNSSKEKDISTTYDGNNTKFSSIIKDTGRIIIFQEIGNSFMFAEVLNYNRNTKFNDVSNFKLNNNHIYIGLPKLDLSDVTDVILPIEYATSTTDVIGLLADLRAIPTTNSWEIISSQSGKINLATVSKAFLYSKESNDIIANLDILDPRQGKIPGVADQEISFKTFYDPAIYSVNQNNKTGITVDVNANWTDNYVGKLWWSIGSATWINPYQGSVHYRSANWNMLADSGSIEIYEWVKTTLTPLQYRAQSDTSAGFANGISGTPKFGDTIYSSSIDIDSISGKTTEFYYFWVRNNKIIPRNVKRRLSSFDIEQLILNPSTNGYRYIAPLGTDQFALHNIQSLISGTDTILHIEFERNELLETNIHSEYELLTEGLDISTPSSAIEQKWYDSLVGYDLANNPVPDTELPAKQKYGILNSPRQSMFINRLEAVKQFVERVNDVLVKTQIVDNYVIDQLVLKDEIPLASIGRYDSVVSTVDDLRFVGVAKVQQAILLPIIVDGKISDVTIISAGRGYKISPQVKISSNSGKGAIIKTEINSIGQIIKVTILNQGKKYSNDTTLNVRKFSVLVIADAALIGRWAIYTWSSISQTWDRTDNQSFNTSNYWEYRDWYATDYSNLTSIDLTVDQSYELFAANDAIGDIVKINTIGSGGWLLLEKINDRLTEDYTINYKTVGRENGTIQLATRLYDYATVTSGYDALIYDNAFYDREPIIELRNILTALRDDIFIGDLAVEYNKTFFAGLRYAFSEQVNVDWAFKTSFIRAKHNVGKLLQKVTFQNDNLDNYEDYVKEVKPFSSKVREYISSYNHVESTSSLTTDFDIPPSYNVDNNTIETISAQVSNGEVIGIVQKYMNYPYKSWVDNNGYEVVEIKVSNSGSGYTQTPTVVVEGDSTTATAYTSKGKVTSIEITNTGNKFYKAPLVTISGTQTAGGQVATAVAILGNGLIRTAHLTIKFDRTQGTYSLTDLNVTEVFSGTGAKQEFNLKWPMNIRSNSFSIYINNRIQLSSNFEVSNNLDTSKGYARQIAKIKFITAPPVNSVVTVNYKKDVTILNAADRIYSFYNPTSGMPGKELAQLMTGVEYSGAIYDGSGFGNAQGWDPESQFSQGFGATPWDTFDKTYDDEIFVLDGSTSVLELATPLENGVEYNVYLNNTRLDDPEFSTGGVVSNPNAVMQTIVGNGITTAVNIEDIGTVVDADIIIIRKSTSDGSFTPNETLYDTALQGGNLAYNTATGLASEDIVVDGDSFVTQTSSKGPEELVPGQLLDTLDIQVYHKPSNGIGVIGVASYRVISETSTFKLPQVPNTSDSLIVKLNGEILAQNMYTVDWKNRTITTIEPLVFGNLTITTIGTNGVGILDNITVEAVGNTDTYISNVLYNDQLSALITVNGKVLLNIDDYQLSSTSTGCLQIMLTNGTTVSGDIIQYTVYNSILQQYSTVQIDNTFIPDGVTVYHTFDTDGPIPFESKPFSHNILIKNDNIMLNPGYSISHTATLERDYNIESWQFDNTISILSSDVIVYVNNKKLTDTEVTYDPVNFKIQLIREDIAPPGSRIDIFVITDADYYFVDTKITFSNNNLQNIATVGSPITFELGNSTVYTGVVKTVSNNSITLEAYRPDITTAFVFASTVIIGSGNTSLSTQISNVEYVESDSMTFAVAPEINTNIEIYTFSNHDINNFSRITYDVLIKSSVTEGTSDFIKRNLLTRGIIKLPTSSYGTPYVWVIVNGKLLTPYADYTVVDSLDAVQLKIVPMENDTVDVLQFGSNPVIPQYGYRIFKDMLNRTHYKRLNQDNSYVLANPLNYYDARIMLTDTTGIFQPNKQKNVPGVLFIDGERIEYFEISGNALLQLRRGTLGTGVKAVHHNGSILLGQGPDENISYQDKMLHQILLSNGTTTYNLDFVADNINEIEVFLGGTRLRKSAIEVYQSNIDQDSNEGNITIPAEFSVTGSLISIEPRNALTGEIINPLLWNNQRIEIIRKIGQVWNTPGKTLADSDNLISRFLRGATIRLPK